MQRRSNACKGHPRRHLPYRQQLTWTNFGLSKTEESPVEIPCKVQETTTHQDTVMVMPA